MEEDTSVKAAAVTRLRRRLSVEQQDDVKSPSTPSTPNKKRGGRLAAKPQLELIDENSSDSTPKKGTRKTAAKVVTEADEEKPVTPARRSARIKSNTSIISDTTLNVESPRAKRAARRTSQIGSDNEAPSTPIKQTRRIKRDSTSSVDNQETSTSKTTTIGESIAEKIQSDSQIFKDNNETTQNKPLRKSPRLRKKHNSSKSLNDSLKITQETQITSTTPEKSSESKESSNPESTRNVSKHDKKQNFTINEIIHDNLSESSHDLIENLETASIARSSNINKSTSALEGASHLKNNSRRTKSMTSSQASENGSHFNSDNDKMIAMNSESRNSNHDDFLNPSIQNEINHSKLTADIQEHKHCLLEKSNDQTLISNPVHGNNVKIILNQPHNINETSKISTKTLISEILTVINLDDSDTNSLGKSNIHESYIHKPVNSEKNIDSCDSNHDNLLNPIVQNESNNSKLLADEQGNKHNLLEESNHQTPISNPFQEDNVKDIRKQPHNLNETSKVLAKPRNTEVITVIYLDDSDTNSSGKNNKEFDNEDQCVPFVVEKSSPNNVVNTEIHQKNISFSSNTNFEPSFKNHCEPMDIDETIPSNVSLIDVSYNKILEEKQNNSHGHKSELYSSQVDLHTNKSPNQSKRESTSSLSVSQNVEKVENENKSTLILSQLNDGSTTENSLSKYPKSTNTEILCKSANNDTTKEKNIDKKNLSLDYMTSTPLQQKGLKKLAMQINTSIINNSKCETKKNTPNNNKLQISKTTNKTNNSIHSSDESESEDESSKEMSNLLDDEAEEASENYESGDSQDEDERQYRKENELVEKGETLTSSDEEDSDDTDYEKDSFVVSSDAEDIELLSGTGDDLSASDNELTMSKKSKKKYNERKLKEQKKASREMFEARHNVTNNSSKSGHTKPKKKNLLRLDSSTLDSEEEIGTGSKKSKRLRLESTQECNIMESESQNTKEANDNKRLSKSSSNDSETREHEMSTTCNISILEKNSSKSEHRKPKKKNRLRLDSSTLDSEEEIGTGSKKSKRLRLEYTQECNIMESESQNTKETNYIKRLSKSSSNDSETREHEMSTTCKVSILEKNSSKSGHTKPKKKNLLRLDSSTLDSEEEIGTGSKKSKRLRLESTQECNIMESESQNTKETNYIKRLSKSIGNDSGIREHEMSTTCNVSILEKKDPLSIEVKPEPQTPLKELNITCVPIMDKIEEIQVNTDISVIKTNETLDPLQEVSVDSNSSSISENLEITDNYETLLKKLNNDVADRKMKSLDISLNLNKKNKLNHKEPIVEQLNLTTIKTFKKNKFSQAKTVDNNNVKGQNKNDCDSSSDSIHLQLLFSDDSVDNMKEEPQTKENFIPLKRTDGKTNIPETNEIADDQPSITGRSNKKKKKSLSNVSDGTERDDSVTMFIDTKGDRNQPDTSINTSKTKKKNNSICVNDGFDPANDVNTEINDSVDKDDNRGEDMSINTSVKKKKKKKSKRLSIEANDNVNAKTEDNGAMFIDANSSRNDTDMSINNNSKKKKKSVSVSDGSDEAKDNVNFEGADNVTIFIDTKGNRSDTDMSLNTSTKKKKKKSICVDDGSVQANDNAITDKDDDGTMFMRNKSDTDMSLNTSVKKKKKKSKNVNDESDPANENVNIERDNNAIVFIDSNDNRSDANVSLNTSAKRKNKKISTLVNDGSDQTNDNINTETDNVTMLIDTKYDGSNPNMSLNTITKKKKKKNKHVNDESVQANDNVTTGTDNDATMFIDSKGNRSDTHLSLNTSAKKKKKKNSTCINDESDQANVNTEGADNVTMFIDTKGNRSDTDMSLNTSSKKKKKKNLCIDDESVQAFDNATTEEGDSVTIFIDTKGNRSEADMSLNTSVKNKKKKSKTVSDGSDQANDNVVQDEDNDAPLETSYQYHKNISSDAVLMFMDTEGETVGQMDSHTSLNSSAKKKKKKNKNKALASESEAVAGTSQDEIKVAQLNENNIEEKKIVAESKGNVPESNEGNNSKKRKRKSSDTLSFERGSQDHLQTLNISKTANESLSVGNQKKKQKINQTEVDIIEKEDAALKKDNKKRKRDDNGIEKSAKQLKQSSPAKVNVPRLPTTILSQLDEKPSKQTLDAKKSKVVSTSHFVVEDSRRKRAKPSNYLEESIYLNDSHDEKKQKGHIKIPKVLPFVPTASTSGTGFTTNFVINVIPKETKFIAQTSNMTGFKNEYLRDKNIKKMGTYKMYRRQRNVKMSKF